MKTYARFRSMSLITVLLLASAPLWAQAHSGWQPAELESVEFGKTLAAASTVGHYSAGQQSGRSRFVVSCRLTRVFCMDCRDSGDKTVREYSFAWILPPVRSINFEPLGLGAGQANELISLGLDPNPPTPRRSDESVMSDGRWKISFKSKPEDILALKENAGKKATLVLHGLPGSGAVTIRTTIPPRNPAFQVVADACSDASFQFVGGITTCPPRAGHELTVIKMCSGVSLCDEPEPTKEGAIWHLLRTNNKEPGRERFYRLVCEYKKSGSENDTVESITEINLPGN